MDAMLESFISESRENLETAGRCFLELEKRPDDEELLDDLFRTMHTVKGSSGLFDIPGFTKVVHAAEDVLDRVRSGDFFLTPEHVDLFLDTMDQIGIWLDDLEESGVLGEGAETNSQSLTYNLRQLLGENKVDESDASTTVIYSVANSTDDAILGEPPSWLHKMPDNDRLALFKRANDENLSILAIEYAPDPQCFFSGDDPLHTIRSLSGMVWFQTQIRDAWPEPVVLDPYQCNLVFYTVAAGSESEIRHYLRYVTEQTTITPLSPLQLALPTGEVGDSEPYEDFINDAPQVMAKKDWKQLQRLIAPLLEISGLELLQSSVFRWMDTLVQQENPESALVDALLKTVTNGTFEWPDFVVSGTTSIKSNNDKTVIAATADQASETQKSTQLSAAQQEAAGRAMAVQKQILTMPCPPELRTGRIASVSTVVENLLNVANIDTDVLEQAVISANTQESLEPLATYLTELTLGGSIFTEQASTSTPEISIVPPPKERRKEKRRQGERRSGDRRDVGNSDTSPHNKTLKVDQQRIDALMDLVGELVVAKNALPFLAKRADEEFGVRQLAKEIKAQHAVINRLSEELQSTMMQVRMVPISNVFQRFPRLVRDLSRKLDKQIRLVLEGEDTEADKNVVENLADPLIHLVRNSLDHGLENATERKAAGKPIEGTLILRAIPHDDQVVIEIIDDGRGIDPEVIKRKAYEKGIIDEQRLDTISDQEALQLILTAGFSTAEEISDLSGRGVGMDVVGSVVNQAGGSVVVDSTPGQGSTIRLALPLSMAVNRVMMIEIAGQSYGISMEDIVETVRVPVGSIQRIKHNEVLVLRSRLIPLFHLRDLLQLEPVPSLPEEVAVLVMMLGGEEVGLVIDEFNEGIDIIQKPLEGVMANYPYYSGAALLGDGRVLLILNTRELLACR